MTTLSISVENGCHSSKITTPSEKRSTYKVHQNLIFVQPRPGIGDISWQPTSKTPVGSFHVSLPIAAPSTDSALWILSKWKITESEQLIYEN